MVAADPGRTRNLGEPTEPQIGAGAHGQPLAGLCPPSRVRTVLAAGIEEQRVEELPRPVSRRETVGIDPTCRITLSMTTWPH